MTDITELAQSLKAAADREMICRDVAETSEIWERTVTPENILALVEALEKAQQRIAELENNEIQEEGNQFLVVRHPGKVPVIKHPVGELEDYLRQIFKANPLATIDIVTHRYYGVGGQFVKDADEYLHEMSVKVEAE
ncbi:ead/Ea22-like family protein [Klebsiella pneumoniae]|uniref:ead/Ea22-like family protein n=1 Tax=Klebsiella pneumoniae TaxID=573 RepID=UPI0039089EE0